mmetsp:Transcript_40018/g.87843  ORF Transcript_40018/g.87843 Transcript_40018/m.87843 type:complete len:115 (-) Transcript_40018:350-694(-)
MAPIAVCFGDMHALRILFSRASAFSSDGVFGGSLGPVFIVDGIFHGHDAAARATVEDSNNIADDGVYAIGLSLDADASFRDCGAWCPLKHARVGRRSRRWTASGVCRELVCHSW